MLSMIKKFTARGLVVCSNTGTPVCCSHSPRTFKLFSSVTRATSSQCWIPIGSNHALSTCISHGSVAAQRPGAGVTAAAAVAAAVPRAANPKLLVIDGHNMAFKAYWGLMNRPGAAFSTADGIPTTVTFGFLRSLIALLEQEQPDALIAVFDAPVKSFRHDKYPEYKAQRAKAPPEFSPDLANLQQLLRFLRIQTVAAPGYEADDAMAGLAQQGSRAGYTVRIYTTDQDLWQVADDAGGVGILVPAVLPKGARKGKGQPVATLVGEAAVRDKLDISPAQVPDYKALVGDASDNLPGIPGIGPKTAALLLQQYGTLEAVFQNMAALKPAVRKKLEDQQRAATMFKNLARIRPEAAPSIDLSSCHLHGFNAGEVKPLLERLEMTSLVKTLPQWQQLLGGPAPPSSELTAAVPEALAVFSSAVPAAAAPAVLQGSEAVHGVGGEFGTPSELPFVQRAKHETGPISVLPDSLQARVPVLSVVVTGEQLQRLLHQLQQHQGVVTWSWPQSHSYTPGSPPQLPSFFCCAWNEVVHAQEIPAAAFAPLKTSTCTGVGSASTNTTAEDDHLDLQTTNKAAATSPRQQKSSPAREPPVAAAVAASTDHKPERQQQRQSLGQALQARLAMIQISGQLPGERVLAALRPSLEDASQSKVLFESKRCYTELQHWGIQLGGVEFDVLVAGYLTDPERWTEGKAKGGKVKALDPERQQHQALPCMVRDVLNTTLPDMQAALAEEYSQQFSQSSLDQQQEEQHVVCGSAGPGVAAAAAAHSSSTVHSRRRLSRRTTRRQTEADAPPEQPSPAAAVLANAVQAAQKQLHQQPLQTSTQQLHQLQQPQQQFELPAAAWHAAAEAWASQALHGAFLQQLQQLDDGGKLLGLLQNVEVPLQRVLSHMEFNGIGLNKEALIQNREALQADLGDLEDKLFKIAGRSFNLGSRQTLSHVMYEELQIKPKDPKFTIPTTPTGMKSTKEEDIRQLEDHPFVSGYLQWVSLNTLLTKYYSDTYINAVNPTTGRVHTTLAQVGAATGRIYSVNPNMQNIPAHMHSTPYAAAFRNAFNHPEDGYVMVSADYSQVLLYVATWKVAAMQMQLHTQGLLRASYAWKRRECVLMVLFKVELRVLAALAEEEALLNAFSKDVDVHAATSRVLLDKGPEEPVSAEERQMGKRVNFSLVYGAGKDKIAQDAGVTPQEAKLFLERFYAAYPRLHSFMNNCHRSAVAKGYTQSILGRRRLFSFQGDRLRQLLGTQDLATLPDMRKLMYMGSREDAQVLRQAGNAPIQGTSADVLKAALCKLHSVLTVPPWNCRLLLTVHDSVVLEVPAAQWPAAKDVIAQLMENVLQEHNLKLKVDIKEGW